MPADAPIILCEQFNYFHACLYVEESSRSMEIESVNEITRIKESDIYTCGSILFTPGSKYEKSIIVREALTCNTTIETQYYGAKLVSFPPICYHCGLGEEYIVSDEELKKKNYAVVYPICFICKSDGQKNICKLPSNVSKK